MRFNRIGAGVDTWGMGGGSSADSFVQCVCSRHGWGGCKAAALSCCGAAAAAGWRCAWRLAHHWLPAYAVTAAAVSTTPAICSRGGQAGERRGCLVDSCPLHRSCWRAALGQPQPWVCPGRGWHLPPPHLHARLDDGAAQDRRGERHGKDEAQAEEHGGGGGAQLPHAHLQGGGGGARVTDRQMGMQGGNWLQALPLQAAAVHSNARRPASPA